LCVVTLVPAYIAGANRYSCGLLWLHGTAAYLYDTPRIEWYIAAMACLNAGLCAYGICELQHRDRNQHNTVVHNTGTTKSNWWQRAAQTAVWAPVVIILGSPIMLAMLSLSLPPNENVLGLGDFTLRAARIFMGASLYVIKSVLLPHLARGATRLIYGESAPPNMAGLFTMTGMLWIAVWAPALTVIAVNQNCFGLWLSLWKPCVETDTFFDKFFHETVGNITFLAPCSTARVCFYAQASTGSGSYNWYAQNTVIPIELNMNITTQADICSPRYIPDGRCPRAVIASLTDLYSNDLIFSFGVGPFVSLLRSTPTAAALKVWFVRNILRDSHYQARTSMDRLIVNVVLMLELPFVLGFCCPWLPLLACLAVGCNAGVFYTSLVQFGAVFDDNDPIRLSPRYLWSSLAIGCALTMWLFFENGLHGSWLLAVGAPSAIVLVLVTRRHLAMRMRSRHASLIELRVPLINAASVVPEHEAGFEATE